MCFAPQRRALFRHLNLQKWSEHGVLCTFWLGNVLRATTACTFQHLNFQKWSEAGVFCTFWLRNVLRATTACTFSTSQLPKVVRSWCALYILTWKCASRHNGVQIFISHLASWLRTRRFSEPTFRPSGATNHWKNMEKRSVSRLSYLFAHLHLLSSDFFSSDLLSSDLFSSDSSHLCFSTVHIVGSFTKLPSTKNSLCTIIFRTTSGIEFRYLLYALADASVYKYLEYRIEIAGHFRAYSGIEKNVDIEYPTNIHRIYFPPRKMKKTNGTRIHSGSIP